MTVDWILVTGGAKRLGAAICAALAEKGYSVVVHYNTSEQEATDVVNTCRQFNVQAEAIQGDFSSSAGALDFINRYLDRFESTRGLINNVGTYIRKSALQTEVSEWEALIQTNLTTPFVLAKALAPSLIANKGSIINLGAANLYPGKGSVLTAAYRVAKGGLWSLTASLAKELAPSRVTVNMVSPGQLDISVSLPSLDQLPMHRPAYCSEVARVILFLLSPESAYITGQNIEVSGGYGL